MEPILEYLASKYAVHLGTFVRDPADVEHAPSLQDKALELSGTARGKSVGVAARAHALADCRWMSNLAPFDELPAVADELRAGTQ